MENTTRKARRCRIHLKNKSSSEPGDRAEEFMRKTFAACLPRSRASSSSDEHIRGKAKYRKPGSYEEALTYPYLLAFAYLFK